jgi:hypothetical protein
MDLPKDFFTLQSMLTLTGASGATFVICNGLQNAFNFNPRWLGLAVAIALMVGGTIAVSQTRAADFLVAVINGFLVYLTAVGGTAAVGGSGATGRNTVSLNQPQRRRFSTPWF